MYPTSLALRVQGVRRAAAVAGVSAGVLLAAGCLRLDGSLTLSPEGSGTLRVTYAMPEQRLQQLQSARDLAERLATAAGGEVPADSSLQLASAFDADAIQQQLKPHLRNGLTLRDLRIGTESGWRRVEILLQFTNLRSVAELPILADWGIFLQKDKQGQYVMTLQTPNLSGEGRLPDLTDPDNAKQLQNILSGLRVTLRTEVPGDILRTNATRHDIRRASWEFDYDRDPTMLQKLNQASLRVDFEGSKLSLPEVAKKPVAL